MHQTNRHYLLWIFRVGVVVYQFVLEKERRPTPRCICMSERTIAIPLICMSPVLTPYALNREGVGRGILVGRNEAIQFSVAGLVKQVPNDE